jgi:hypothetical protein
MMQQTVTIDFLPEILLSLHLNAERFAKYLKMQTVISLFKEGKLLSETAAVRLGIGRVVFLRVAFDAGAILLKDSVDDIAREYFNPRFLHSLTNKPNA